MKKINYIVSLLLLLFMSCSTTKNLPEGEVLYTGIKHIEVKEEDQTKAGENALSEVEAALNYPPNNALLGSSSIRVPFPFGLWVYNAFVNKKGKVNRWIFNKLAAKPVLISTVNPKVRVKVAQNLLREYGYFNGSTAFQLIPDPKNPRKAKLGYDITMNAPYTYDSIQYIRIRHRADTLIKANIGDALLHTGDNFDVTQLEAERQRVSSLLRNNGYYYFRPDFITYQADTSLVPGKVALRVAQKPGLPSTALRPWRIGDISVSLNGIDNEPPTDTLRYKDITIFYEGKLRVRPAVLYNRLRFHTGELYSQQQQEKTQTALARLGIFRYAEMQYTPRDTMRRQDSLDLRINTVYDLPLDGELEVNVTTKSNAQTGPGAVFSLTKRNVFGGGEIFGVSLRGSYEWQTGKRPDGVETSAINSYEFGLSSTLTLPQLLFPGFMQKDWTYPANTTIRLYAEQLRRARFFTMLSFGGNLTYDFQPTATTHHSVTPFKLAYNLISRPTHAFDSIIETNPALKQSLQNQFVPSMSYTYTYDDTPITSRPNHLWWQTSISQAGNLLNAAYAIAGKPYHKEKMLFGNPFAQFVKLTSEIRYNYRIDQNQHLVGRLMAGAIYSYGNARIAPYNEQFYIGGANSIRAFTIRTIGPGRYHSDDTQYGYLDQTGDLKFEANLEYRFRILGDLHGAVFMDSGNIWLIRNNPDRPGGQLKWGSFLNDLALGTGAGVRYVLPFIVFRLDMGVGIHAPYDTGKKGYYNIKSFKDGLGFHLAIGYPF